MLNCYPGGALVDVFENFRRAWERAGSSDLGAHSTVPQVLKRSVVPGTHSSVQIVRTQPQEKDKTIKEMYFLATGQAALASGVVLPTVNEIMNGPAEIIHAERWVAR